MHSHLCVLCRKLSVTYAHPVQVSLQNFQTCPGLSLQSTLCMYVCMYAFIYLFILRPSCLFKHWKRKQIAVEIPSLVISANSTSTSIKKNKQISPSFPCWCLGSRELWLQKALPDRLFSDSCVGHAKAPCVHLTMALCAWHCNFKILCYLNIQKCTLYQTAGAATLLLQHGNTCLVKTEACERVKQSSQKRFSAFTFRYNLLSIPTFTCNGNRFAF